VLFDETSPSDHDQVGGYAYASLDAPGNMRWTFGLGFEHFDGDGGVGSDTRFHPKAGVVASVTEDITFRAAYTSATKRRLVLDQTLEPTTVAGFNQFFDTFNGTEVTQKTSSSAPRARSAGSRPRRISASKRRSSRRIAPTGTICGATA
jgi:hypothetical protein